ncbi:MAG: hypothetical protein GXY42_13940 [Desulfovibrionales bacterium]|mgnify:CR=1 FL=1|nr:hypothetical protein [Desulfovibrionales bacterium]
MQDIIEAGSNHLSIAAPETQASVWAGLLRRGVGVFLTKAVSVRDFMTKVLGMDVQYAINSVPGLFLNNSPVDDWAAEIVGDGDAVGMSGTMPGLCGIALRRSSPIKAFRPDLLSKQERAHSGGVATLKMFNFVATDCFRPILGQGVVVRADALGDFLDDQDMRLDDCVCTWNGTPVSGAEIRRLLDRADGGVVLSVKVIET